MRKANVTKQLFQHIGKRTYVYSAYYDGRDHMVKVIAMTGEDEPTGIYCVLWYKNGGHPKVISAEIHMWNSKK